MSSTAQSWLDRSIVDIATAVQTALDNDQEVEVAVADVCLGLLALGLRALVHAIERNRVEDRFGQDDFRRRTGSLEVEDTAEMAR